MAAIIDFVKWGHKTRGITFRLEISRNKFKHLIENKIPDLHFFIKEILDEHSAR